MSALCISPEVFTSKAALKAALDAEGTTLTKHDPWGSITRHSSEYTVGFSDVVTNHPLRTKFAKIEKRAEGWKVS